MVDFPQLGFGPVGFFYTLWCEDKKRSLQWLAIIKTIKTGEQIHA